MCMACSGGQTATCACLLFPTILTHDGKASPAGDGLDLALSEGLGDDCLHLAPEEARSLRPLGARPGQHGLHSAPQLQSRKEIGGTIEGDGDSLSVSGTTPVMNFIATTRPPPRLPTTPLLCSPQRY